MCGIVYANGLWCGYVGLPENNKYYKKKYDDIPIDCHCGLTYSKPGLFGQNDNDTWWIGFDCGHFFDGIDKDTFNKLYEKEMLKMNPVEYRAYMMNFDCMCEINREYPIHTQEYVENECRKIVDQIVGGGASDHAGNNSGNCKSKQS